MLTSSVWLVPTVFKFQPRAIHSPPPCSTCAFWEACLLYCNVIVYLSSFTDCMFPEGRGIVLSSLYLQNLYLGISSTLRECGKEHQVSERGGEVMKKQSWLKPVIHVGERRWSGTSKLWTNLKASWKRVELICKEKERCYRGPLEGTCYVVSSSSSVIHSFPYLRFLISKME